MTTIDISPTLAKDRKWRSAVAAIRIFTILVVWCGLLTAFDSTYANVFAELVNAEKAEIFLFLLGLPAVLLLARFAVRGERLALLFASALLLVLSAVALLNSVGLHWPLSANRTILAACLRLVRIAFDDRDHLAIRIEAATLVLMAGIPMLVALGGIGSALFGVVISRIQIPYPLTDTANALSSRFSTRGATLRIASAALWIPITTLALLTFIVMIFVSASGRSALIAEPLFPTGMSASVNPSLLVGLDILTDSLICLLLLSSVGGFTWTIARRISQHNVMQLRKRDQRPPIFVIRSFKDEHLMVGERPDWQALLGRVRTRAPFEEVVVNAMWGFGPVLTIGKPGDRIPPLGAAREYVSDDRWRTRVREYLESSRAIVIMVGDTSNFAWECERVAEFHLINKVLALLPPLSNEAVSQRWSVFQKHFRPALDIQLSDCDKIHPLVVAFHGNGRSDVITAREQTRLAYDVALAEAWRRVVPDTGDEDNTGFPAPSGEHADGGADSEPPWRVFLSGFAYMCGAVLVTVLLTLLFLYVLGVVTSLQHGLLHQRFQ